MKRIVLTIAAALLCAFSASAFDWKPQSNEELRSDMLAFAADFAEKAHGTKAGKIVSNLIKKQSKTSDEYSWIADTYETVRKLEAAYGPVSVTESPAKPELETRDAMIRRCTLQLLDYPVHVPDNLKETPEAEREAFLKFKKDYLEQARKRTIAWLNAADPEPGTIRVIKVYNMGFILRTFKKTVLIDLRWDGTAEEADFIAKQADVFFLTHPHGDHYSQVMLDALQKAKVPVVMPSDLMPSYNSDLKHIIWGNDRPATVNDVRFTSLKGYQDDVPNNVYTIDFDGWRIVDAGDNADDELEKRLASQGACDLVIAACWNNIQNILGAVTAVDGAAPLFVSAHENEFGHGVGNRESYHELYQRKDRFANPDFDFPAFVLMDIGENIEISRPELATANPNDVDLNVGYGSIKSSKNTYAVSQVKLSESDSYIYNNMTDYLAGRVAGLDVSSDGKIRIRGDRSFMGSNEPLIVVDGHVISDINSISPRDVAKVEVLKDSSASIYGARGANGVILITLKH